MARAMIPLAAIGAGIYLAMTSEEAGQGSEVPRGIRNNNPGNIEKGAAWQGLADDQSQDDRFAVFQDAKWGIRAMARVLDTYRTRHGLDTVQGIVSRWAPSVENNTGAYVDNVASKVGAAPTDPLPDDTATTMALIKALIQHENGYNPYPDTLIRQGVSLA